MTSRWAIVRRMGSLVESLLSFARRRPWLTAFLVAASFAGGIFMVVHRSDIQQLDRRYRVVGFKVSRGRSHTLAVRHEVCRIGGLRFARAVEETDATQFSLPGKLIPRGSSSVSTNPPVRRKGMPLQIAGWLRFVGLRPQVDNSQYSHSVFGSEESCAIMVRFAHSPKLTGYSNIAAILIAEDGERIPLAPQSQELPASCGEYVKFWMIDPAPKTRSRFQLLLRLGTEGKDLARLKLKKL